MIKQKGQKGSKFTNSMCMKNGVLMSWECYRVSGKTTTACEADRVWTQWDAVLGVAWRVRKRGGLDSSCSLHTWTLLWDGTMQPGRPPVGLKEHGAILRSPPRSILQLHLLLSVTAKVHKGILLFLVTTSCLEPWWDLTYCRDCQAQARQEGLGKLCAVSWRGMTGRMAWWRMDCSPTNCVASAMEP
jgi:hypothetical protein